MPELPEVHSFKRYFDATALHQRIEQAYARDDYIFKNMTPAEFEEKLRGRQFTGSYRRGKYFFAELDNGHDLLIHFGMSGSFKYYSNPEDQPKYEHMAFEFDNGFTLGFNCPRKLARIRYLADKQTYIREKGLGPDAAEISGESFLALFEGKKGTLKGMLMNQQYLAGLGNLYVDEICYQAGVHPASRVDELKAEKQKLLFSKMKEILKFALDKNATYSEYPEDWLWRHREAGKNSPDGSGPIKRMKIAGRSTYFVPERQKIKE